MEKIRQQKNWRLQRKRGRRGERKKGVREEERGREGGRKKEEEKESIKRWRGLYRSLLQVCLQTSLFLSYAKVLNLVGEQRHSK